MHQRSTNRLRWLLALLILASCIGCDQATKFVATKALQPQARHSFCADTVRFEYSLNPGGFLSLGADLPGEVRQGLFLCCNSLLTLALCTYLWRNHQISLTFFASLVLVVAGGLGNMIDRACNNGLVTDFLNIGIGPVRTGIFNVADIAITGGALAAIVLSWRDARPSLHHSPNNNTSTR
ncbi:lipoprotein signal peptidase [Anatilimnocola aggregata]|uniref:Lipoprotein signal peptidase n=1 Tax=Anatilimnocola aggregata TaxID=2528021 RepID=A0A517YMP8_9BACT|nr:signal peptidase II [Anatilimnocola aggregata]QDU31500.1 lipoprotein signal peptidase [Anatilimnocola aggregata]